MNCQREGAQRSEDLIFGRALRAARRAVPNNDPQRTTTHHCERLLDRLVPTIAIGKTYGAADAQDEIARVYAARGSKRANSAATATRARAHTHRSAFRRGRSPVRPRRRGGGARDLGQTSPAAVAANARPRTRRRTRSQPARRPAAAHAPAAAAARACRPPDRAGQLWRAGCTHCAPETNGAVEGVKVALPDAEELIKHARDGLLEQRRLDAAVHGVRANLDAARRHGERERSCHIGGVCARRYLKQIAHVDAVGVQLLDDARRGHCHALLVQNIQAGGNGGHGHRVQRRVRALNLRLVLREAILSSASALPAQGRRGTSAAPIFPQPLNASDDSDAVGSSAARAASGPCCTRASHARRKTEPRRLNACMPCCRAAPAGTPRGTVGRGGRLQARRRRPPRPAGERFTIGAHDGQ
jgi:hypothetical protein